MKINRTIISLGNSLGLTIDKTSCKLLNLHEGDIVSIEIESINNESVITSYKCLACEACFDSADDIVYCPNCQNENAESIKPISYEESLEYSYEDSNQAVGNKLEHNIA